MGNCDDPSGHDLTPSSRHHLDLPINYNDEETTTLLPIMPAFETSLRCVYPTHAQHGHPRRSRRRLGVWGIYEDVTEECSRYGAAEDLYIRPVKKDKTNFVLEM